MAKSDFDISKREFMKRCLAVSAGLCCMPAGKLLASGIVPEDDSLKKIALYQEETPRGIMCRICPNECVLREGEISKCNNRMVRDGKLWTMAYGNPCSVNIDPVEKKPLYHFYPGSRAFSIATAGCNLVCLNCQNWQISQISPDKTRNIDMMPDKVVTGAVSGGCISIAYTYTEPVTFFEYTFDTAVAARRSGIKNIVKSNGYINPDPLKKLCTVIDAANIDLKSFNDATYLKLTGGKLQPVLDSLKIYRDAGIWLEITNLVVPEWSDNIDEIGKMCKWLSENGFSRTPLHFSRFYPTHKLEQLPPTASSLLKEAAKVAGSEGLKYVYTGNIPGDEVSDTICPSCSNAVVTRVGFRVTSESIKNGRCGKCGNVIDGIWN